VATSDGRADVVFDDPGSGRGGGSDDLVRCPRCYTTKEPEMDDNMTIGELGHRPGLHVEVNVEGTTVAGALIEDERWLAGVVAGAGGNGTFVTIELAPQPGVPERRGLFRSAKRELVQVDDPARVRPVALPDGIPPDVIDLARAGKTNKAILRYRELTGATLDEARATIAKL
jgi:hypothetical protein